MAITKLGNKATGSIIKIKENGTLVDFYVAKHDYESGLNGTGRTLVVRKDCFDTRQWHTSNVNAYASSAIDAWLNGTYKAMLDADIRGVLGTTKFYYTPGNGTTSVTTLQRAVFLLSVTELGKTASYCNNHSYNKDSKRTAMIKAAANQSPPVYGFDCVNLIKGVLWGWCGAPSKTYGGAGYAVNGVPDVGADGMIKLCTDVSTTGWASMVPGEAVWCSGHIGVYIGNGLAVECTPRWENNVQITAVANIGKKAGYNARTWTKHGKMPWVDYTGATTGGSVGEVSEPTKPATSAQELTVGAVVAFTGTKHYVSSSSTAPKNCKPGEAKITAVAKGARHPYHLVRTAGSASTVYGWVDATDITTEASGAIVKGSTVKVKKGAKTYTGGGLASFVYSGIYTVLEVSGSRVVISKGNAVTAAVNIKDLTLVG